MKGAHTQAGEPRRDDGVAAPRKQQTSRTRPRVSTILIALIAWLGVALALYPTAAGWVSQYNQSMVIDKARSSQSNLLLDSQRRQDLAAAEAYNANLSSGAIYRAGTNVPSAQGDTASDTGYWNLLNPDNDGVMGRLQIPSIDVDLPIYHGTSDDVLAQGIGHLQGTSLPVGGESTHAVLTGHRGLASSVLFTYLDRVQKGDTFSVTVEGRTAGYRVIDVPTKPPPSACRRARTWSHWSRVRRWASTPSAFW